MGSSRKTSSRGSRARPRTPVKASDPAPETAPDAPPEPAADPPPEPAPGPDPVPEPAPGSAAGSAPVRATAVYNTRIWGRDVGDREEVELTDLIRSVAADGRISLLDADGNPVAVVRPVRADAPRPARVRMRPRPRPEPRPASRGMSRR